MLGGYVYGKMPHLLQARFARLFYALWQGSMQDLAVRKDRPKYARRCDWIGVGRDLGLV